MDVAKQLRVLRVILSSARSDSKFRAWSRVDVENVNPVLLLHDNGHTSPNEILLARRSLGL